MSHRSAAREVTAPRSRFYHGPYGRLFDDLEPWRPVGATGAPITDGQALEEWCLNVANTLMVEKLLPDATPVPPRDIDEDATLRVKFLLDPIDGTAVHDLPRNSRGRALIGDPRNDENSIVSQLHVSFLAAHNTLVDRAAAESHAEPFDVALRKDVGADGRTVWTRGLDDVYAWRDQPYMPVEFAGAAYRFGHSMVRSKYKTNIHRGALDEHFVPIFDNTTGAPGVDLRGFRPLGIDNAIEWDWFLRMTSSIGEFPQKAHRIDTKLTNALPTSAGQFP
ncbi:hypothetical protein [Mycolicibacterium litorale]|uniref:hypothetical protein n=1 Tax=Mycolicibacterium litorale TaxID=758802 RepID=UPI0039A3765D